MSISLSAPPDLPLDLDSASSLPDGLRRQVARFLLRWQRGDQALPLLPARDVGPRDRFDRCRALIAAGEIEKARDLARTLVNEPEAGHWGHRAVGEVFLALDKPDRADERFRAGGDPVGRARAWLKLGNPEAALRFLPSAPEEDPEAEAVRMELLRELGQDVSELEGRLRRLLEDEQVELREAVGAADLAGPVPVDEAGLKQALERVFGYGEFRPGQTEIIQPLLEGRSVLGLMPTGAGKSICFQLPAALLPGATVVISPLIALMKDQVDGLPPSLYRRATLINSSLEPGEADARLEQVARGEVSLIYAAPERLRQRTFVRALQRRGVSLFVIDEAHCVSLWGHDFRPDYFFIREVLRDLGRPTVLALTATATPEMQDDIGRQLDVALHKENLGTFRPNLQLSARRCRSEVDKWSALLELAQEERGPAIVYVDRRRIAEELAEKLRQEGIAAEAYHAGMERGVRDAVQNRFMSGKTRIITATVAFGMGVDKADVRLVVHYNLSRSLEAYYQEAGRAGRDGLPAKCVLLFTSTDKGNLTRRTKQDRFQAGEVLAFHRTLSRRLGGEWTLINVEELERETAFDGTRVRVAISLLQSLGVVERSYDLPGTIGLALNPNALEMGDEGFRRFAQTAGLGERGWTNVPAHLLAKSSGRSVEALETALLDWQEAGWIRFRSGGRGMGLRMNAAPADFQAQVAALLTRMEAMDTRRLELLARYLDSHECRQGFVSRYFGRELEAGCGVCDNCVIAAESRHAPRVLDAEARSSRTPADYPQSDEESHLFELLRAWRRERARDEGVPAYVIFHDRVLYAIARERPKSMAELAAIPGIGRGTKLQTFGDEVVSIVRDSEP